MWVRRWLYSWAGGHALSAPASSANALEQIGRRGELQSAGKDHDRLQPRRALAALEQADLGAVQIAHVGERLLRYAHARPVAPQVGGELFASIIHAPHCGLAQTEDLQTIVLKVGGAANAGWAGLVGGDDRVHR